MPISPAILVTFCRELATMTDEEVRQLDWGGMVAIRGALNELTNEIGETLVRLSCLDDRNVN